MNSHDQIKICLALAVLLACSPAIADAQSAVAPSTTIRVIEILDPATGWRVREVAQDLTQPEISRIQRALASAGFDPGRATGVLNATTLVALDRFQSSRGLIRCGCISYETILALGIRPDIVATLHAPHTRGGAYGSRILVLAPYGRRSVGVGHQPAVIVGHGPSVFVGHDPARGAGELGRRGHPPDRRPHVRDPRPPRPRPGSTISGSGAPLRRITPRPQPATPRPPRTP